MPIASYSGSYQPAPNPTSTRPPLTQSSVARLLASTAAGRSASHITRVPSRTSGTSGAKRAEGDERIEAASRLARAAVLGQVEEEMVGEPQRIRARARCDLGVLHDGPELQRALAGYRVVVLGQRQAEVHGRRLAR